MSKELVVKTDACYQGSAAEPVQPSFNVSLADPQYIKTMTVNRITFPKGFLLPGHAYLIYYDSNGAANARTSYAAGVNARRWGDIYHAAFELSRWIAVIDALTADNLQVAIDDSKAHIVIRSNYAGANTPYLYISSSFPYDSKAEQGFARYCSNALGLPLYPAYLEFPAPGNYEWLSYYDSNGGVDEIYMTSEDLAMFEEKYSTPFEAVELNSTIMTFPAPNIVYRTLLELDTWGDPGSILKYYMMADTKLYERQTYNASDMLTPFSITFDSQITISNFDLKFYVQLDDYISPVYFPTPVGVVFHIESDESIEREEVIAPFHYGGGRED